jgi:hypothetical protein
MGIAPPEFLRIALFLRWGEFSGVGEDLDKTAGKASEKAA